MARGGGGGSRNHGAYTREASLLEKKENRI